MLCPTRTPMLPVRSGCCVVRVHVSPMDTSQPCACGYLYELTITGAGYLWCAWDDGEQAGRLRKVSSPQPKFHCAFVLSPSHFCCRCRSAKLTTEATNAQPKWVTKTSGDRTRSDMERVHDPAGCAARASASFASTVSTSAAVASVKTPTTLAFTSTVNCLALPPSTHAAIAPVSPTVLHS